MSTVVMENQVFGEISNEISNFWEEMAEQAAPSYVSHRPGAWAPESHPPFTQRILHGPLVDAIQFVQSYDSVFATRKGNTVEAQLIAEEQVDCLRSVGFDLDSAPETIRESDLTNPEQIIYYNDRPVSVDFLFRLNACQRFRDVLEAKEVVILEIGGGVGALARTIKLLNPSTRYIIIDLLDTLMLSYGFFCGPTFQMLRQLSSVTMLNSLNYIILTHCRTLHSSRRKISIIHRG